MEENISSKESSGVDNVSTEGLDSNGNCYPAYPNKHLGHCSKESDNKFKGIMPPQIGSWGSQVYANGHQIWLGTFTSEKKPEMAYDSVTIQLCCGDSHQNFPQTNVIVKEPNFQNQYFREAAPEMIRGGSCQPRFRGLDGDNCGNTESGTCGLNHFAMQKRGCFSCKLLFRKMLTPSDVGRLNRIVIPKKYATTCFSDISRKMEEDAKSSELADVQVDFFDRMMRSWKFRYCYWKSSQSYVFTRGWSRFVKDKQLKVNEVVAFYLCEVQGEGKIVNKFFMIDPVRGEDSSGSSSGSVIEVADHNFWLNQPEMFSSVFESASYHHVELTKPELCSDVEKRLGKQVVDADPPSNVERKGFRLFGVQID
ncbi:AP2/ERF and B3 domain-containing transcription factor At1g50680-like [Neltuma alba]|uniref:AP2/ERF and B3 domain-containing transcription factor At1g50680-like n=1 Tax=Neltuma alba TaxID=207710 RepID=UPI0010A5833F|nr:AP2/ERF and B3 domain-containing transcription factor At1g50680-like [Prosopis alba]XP_028794008.1 AP2/ERF and B3 domain-containing transcription factor At1g50680-like [Prosopis alba]XP_028794009.1 AP2/ERF and B3 domain-containing transcription factor At1g50680-like [Prosopis alba]XP_028794010.1 AP2/ERF and B3 domain-containing transcription factor At1g50680-like [Prosopis alba]XP_028794011.1 AP2/ERF and B3 domain-containing transcription factor At1g50680-like [Prosopis alba]XP_028794012.1 